MIVLLDSMFEVHRQEAATGHLATKSGKKTGLVFGFMRALGSYLKLYKTVPVVVWDGSPIARRSLIAKYKSTRNKGEEYFYQEIRDLKGALSSMGVVQVVHKGWEADDVLGTLALHAESKGQDVSIVTGDHDLLQLVNSRIENYNPKTKETMGEDWVVEHYKVKPEWLAVLWAITGDPSDNIEGIKGIGEKGALEIINHHASLGRNKADFESTLAQQNIAAEQFKVALDALRLRTNLLPELEWNWPKTDYEASKVFWESYEFKSFLKEGSPWPEFVSTAGKQAETIKELYLTPNAV